MYVILPWDLDRLYPCYANTQMKSELELHKIAAQKVLHKLKSILVDSQLFHT
jgi:hypothetical protein